MLKSFRVNGVPFIWANCRCSIKQVPAPLKGRSFFGCPTCMGRGKPREIFVVLQATEWDELDPDDN